MTSASAPQTVHFIAKILAVRETPQEEIPALIAAVHRGIAGLSAPAPPPAPAVATEAAAAERTPRARRPRAARPVFQDPGPAPAPAAAVAPRLMRRAEVAAKPAESPVLERRPTTRAALRGIVKWYDPRSRSGAVRLPGYSGDIAVSPEALDRAGIPRLFKGQEIEASVTETAGVVSLLTLSLPGRPETDTIGGGLLGAPRRNARPVVIEMKRDGLRRVAARVEAEQLLGAPRMPSET
jgi:cold shock CspA family protein